MAIRLDGTFSTFNSHGELACRANTHGDWKGAGRTLLSSHSLSLSLSFVRPRIEKVRIQMRRNDHGYPGGLLLHAPLEDRESLCFPRSEKPFGYIDREGAQNVSALQRFARSSYLSSSLGFSPQDAISSAEVMRCLNRECRFSVSLKIYLDLRFQILFSGDVALRIQLSSLLSRGTLFPIDLLNDERLFLIIHHKRLVGAV